MSESPGIRAWIRLFREHVVLLGTVSLAAGLLALGIAFLLPRWYEARASILPPHEEIRQFAGKTSLGLALQPEMFRPYTESVTLGDVYLAILHSDALARRLIERFDLRTRYGQKGITRTLLVLHQRTKLGLTPERAIEVRVEDREPGFAAALANAYIEELDAIFRETRSSVGKRQRLFLETRSVRARAEVDSMENALTELQTRRGLTTLSRDLTETALAAGRLMGSRLALQVRLAMLDDLGAGATPMRRQLEVELHAVEGEAAKLPVLGMESARMIRDLRTAEIFQAEIRQLLEVARIEEVRDTPAVEVLDRAVAPDRHVRPRRGLTALAGAFAAFGVAFLGVVSRAGAMTDAEAA